MNNTIPPVWCPGFNTAHPLAKHVTGYWPGWDGGGKRVMDLVGGKHGTAVTGAASPWKVTQKGRLLDCPLTSDRIETSIPFRANQTYFCRFRPYQTGTVHHIPLGQYQAGQRYYIVLDGGAKTVGIGLGASSGAAGVVPVPFAWGDWVTMAMTYDGSTAKAYFNGRFVTSKTEPPVTLTQRLQWMTTAGASSDLWSARGVFGEGVFCRRCLGEAEILYLHDYSWGLALPPWSPERCSGGCL